MATKLPALDNRFILFFSIVAFSVACGRKPTKQNYFPETGPDALYQRSLELQNPLNVLSIAIQPGYEDLQALAYFRLGRGAEILSAYVTNGEAGESDLRDDYPHQIAATRRIEAKNALAHIGGEVHFLNFPDIAAAKDSAAIRKLWPKDALQRKLRLLVDQFKPDIILVPRDWRANGKSRCFDILCADILTVLQNPQQVDDARADATTMTPGAWTPARVFIDNPQHSGLSIPVDEKHPRFSKTYRAIGSEAATAYHSLFRQRKLWMAGTNRVYSLLYPKMATALNRIDQGMPRIASAHLRTLATKIGKLAHSIQKGMPSQALPELVSLLDSVNYRLVHRHRLNPEDLRLLLHWKKALDRLHCTILGVSVRYTVSDTALTERQLTYVRIDSVSGLDDGGKTEIYFGGLDKGWAVNEQFRRRFPLQIGEPYRLLTPKNITFTYPPEMYGLKNAKLNKRIMFFIIHRSPDPQKSFVHRTVIQLSFAPRFITEVLTPIVRVVSGERVAVRLQNLSRDGVADTLQIAGDHATSRGYAFRLSHKEASYSDSLLIFWKDVSKNGSYVIPLQIHGIKVAQFAARKFDAKFDLTKRIGIISAFPNSILLATLHRMNANRINLDHNADRQLASLDVLIIDQRALTLVPNLRQMRDQLNKFVDRGGHLVILPQDARVWNTDPLWPGILLSPSRSFDEKTPVSMLTTHPFLSVPNEILAKDWENWLFLRAYSTISGNAVRNAEIPVRTAEEQTALLLSQNQKRGRITYINLALKPQLFNIHAGTFRLLANILSYDPANN